MVSEEEKQEFLKDQMKAMLGPCMITFAIPLTIPGLTLTLVVYSGDTTFPKYGALHVVGLIFLAVSVILIVLGCVFRCVWKPRMDPEVIQQLTPANSIRSRSRRDVEAGRRERTLNNVYKGDNKDNVVYSPRPTQSSQSKNQNLENETIINENNAYQQNGLRRTEKPKESTDFSCTTETRKTNIQTENTTTETNISDESNESDSRPGDYLQKRHKKNSTPLKSPRHSRHLAPLLTTNEQSVKRSDSPTETTPSYEEIQKWRRKKKKKSKQRSNTGFGVDNHGSECDERNSDHDGRSSSGKAVKQDGTSHVGASESEEDIERRKTHRTAENNLLEKDSYTTEKKRKKKKKKLLKPVENSETVSAPSTLGHTDLREEELKHIEKHHTQNITTDDYLDDSDASIGSADSVLAQYTSRSHKNY